MSKRRAFVGATIINGDKTKPVIQDGLILVNEDGILEYVGNRREIPVGTQTVDVTGKFIMPGLINAHVHHFNMGGPRNNMAGTEAVLLFAISVPPSSHALGIFCYVNSTIILRVRQFTISIFERTQQKKAADLHFGTRKKQIQLPPKSWIFLLIQFSQNRR